jgi:sulfonate transport system ATP-binding protein
MTAAIEATGVTKRFGRDVVLHDLSLEVQPSEIACLIGPSGCGKSTLLRLISGLERGHTGRLTIAAHEVTGPSRAVGLMFQEPRLLPWATVHGNLALALALPRGAALDRTTPPFGGAAGRGQAPTVDARVATLLGQVHLTGAAQRLPRQLSGGMAQRVALARALAAEPGVLLLDEPFSAVDALTRMTLQDLVLEIWQRTRITVLLVTHDLDEALYLSDRVFVMAGKPATVTDVIRVGLPRPRDRRDPELARRRVHLLDALQGASHA